MPAYDIHERAACLFAPDSLLATQYFDRIRPRKDLTGEQRLMIAVMEHAIDDYMKHVAARDRLSQRLFDDAEQWIESADRSWLCSFETICDHLGLDVDSVRGGLRRCKARARGESVPIAAASDVATQPDRRRASNE
jgi:hypothetical protein